MPFHDTRTIESLAADLAARIGGGARVAAILGSGFEPLTALFDRSVRVPYAEIPGITGCAAPGHAGELVAGEVGGERALFFSGRLHLYEGRTAAETVVPVALARALGARVLLLTCAAGATTERHRPGDLVLIEDHLNLTGGNPLLGVPMAARRPAFLAMGDAYDADLLARAAGLASELAGGAARGVLAGLAGPCFETPAEYSALARLGADLVSMSCVLETIAARYLGMRVLALSLVANGPARAGGAGADGQSVLSVVASGVRERLGFFEALLPALARL